MSVAVTDTDKYLAWEGPLAIDADGSPRAYGPASSPGLDYLANAGSPGNWYGILTDASGNPIVQGPNDPYPGKYISPTSLADHGYSAHDPRRYVDSEATPYLAVPSNAIKQQGVHLGDVGFAYNRATAKMCPAVVADVGPKGKYGEGSIALATALGIKNVSPRNGGASLGIVVVVFKKSSLGWPRQPAEVNDQVQALLAAAGGLSAFVK